MRQSCNVLRHSDRVEEGKSIKSIKGNKDIKDIKDIKGSNLYSIVLNLSTPYVIITSPHGMLPIIPDGSLMDQ